jgi:hypothetical protein
VTNTREKYSIEILRAAKTDLFDLSVIASGAVETPAQAANLMVFLNYMEELYNGYEIIMIDFDARPRFAQLPNLKNVRYFNLNGASRSEDAVVDFAASKTNRKYLAYWNYQSLPDPKTIKEKMAELESKKRMVEIMNGGDYVYRGIKNKHFKGIKLFPNENAYSLV